MYSACHLDEPMFLVIYEISRGSCAQIFGDISQLLDRSEDEFSKYIIILDTDITRTLREISGYEGKFRAAYPDIKYHWEDNLMALPFNLSIIATMNH